ESSKENAKKKRALSETSCSVNNMATNNSLHSSENPVLQGQAELGDATAETLSRSSASASEEPEGHGASTAVDEDFAQVALCSPFSDLISRLYKLHGHTPPKELEKHIGPFPSTTIQELYNLASGILRNWDNETKLAQKDCL
ncbi:hypothetical protein BGX34_007424, partial [Mortierella sp. NVP85]